MEEIEIPDFDDDDGNDFQLPNFPRNGFGNGSSTSLNEYEGANHRHHPSADTIPRFGGPSTTPNRPTAHRAPASHTVGVPTQSYGQDVPAPSSRGRVGQFSNGSQSSIVTAGTSIGSTPGFLASRKGSLASIKNAFNRSGPSAVPPVPTLDANAYPTLRNPFSRFEGSASPAGGMHGQSPRAGRGGSSGSPGPSHAYGRNQSIATNHSSHRSQGGRSFTSQGSSNFRAEDHPMPSLPPIPTRSTPSRLGKAGSGSGSSLHFGGGFRRHGSIGGDEPVDGKTPGEEALRVVFKDFKEVADAKIGRICGRPLNTQPSLPAYLESSSDTQLDTLIGSLAHCSRRHPRRVVDILHAWCRSHCEGIGASEVRAQIDRSHGLQMRVEDAAAILGGRKSAAAKYILNRALIELVRITPKEIMGEELGMTLEGNAFAAYRNDKGDELSPHKKAVAVLQVELLGELSKTRFLTISDRFIREMSKYAALPSTKDTDIRMEHLLRGMRHLKIRVYPEDELEMSSEFIQALASLYASPHVTSQGLKNAYADTLVHLLHPVIETATAEVNHPMWSKAIALILQKALAAASKPKYWATSFPLVVVALGVSPRDVFMQQWQGCMDAILPKLRDRSQRVIALNSFNRLLWIYLNRCSESITSTRKRLDQLTKVFFSTNGALFPSDIPPDVFTCMLHYIITRQLDYGEEFLKDFLRGMDGSVSDPALATRAACLMRAISATLLASEEERHAAWPISADFSKLPEDGPAMSGDTLPEEVAHKDEIPELLARCGPAVASLLFNCDRAAGTILLSSDAVTVTGTASSSAIDNAEVVTRKHGDVHASYATRHEPVMRLITAVLESIPRALAPDVSFPPIANALCRGTFSADPRVCETAAAAMKRVASDPTRCLFLVNTYREFIFETRHIFRDTFIGSRLLESQFERVVGVWLDLLQQLVQHQRYAGAQPEEGTPRPPTIGPTAMAKIEGCGLFLLCSTALPLRKLAGHVLAAARDLEGTQRRPSAAFRYSRLIPDQAALSRVIQIYEIVPDEAELANMRRLPWLSGVDRQRFDVVAKEKGKILQRLAESEVGKDTTLWLSILPYFVSRVVEQLPGPVNELRSVLIPIAMRLQVHVAAVANVGSARAAATTKGGGGGMTHRSSSDVAILADHWRTYLSVLCVTMPSPASQPATPSIPRTKDVIILTPDTISTPVLFHYLTSLLAWEDSRYRDAAVYAMGCTGQSHLRALSEILLGVVRRLADTKKTASQNSLWTAVAHVFRLISPLILDVKSNSHLANLSSMVSFVRVTYNMLADQAVREDYELQSLRRSFCIVVENLTAALGKLDASDRFFGEELRGAIFKLCYEWCHVGRRPDVAKARESHTLQVASDSYKGERDRAQYLDDLQAKTKLLSAAAAEAMAGLCQGTLVTSTESTPAVQASSHIVDPLIVLRWIRGMFTSTASHHHETARKALHSLIKHNWNCSRLLDEVLHQSFGEGEQFSLESSFFGVVAEILVEQTLDIPVEQLCCLALSKLGHPVADVRLRAFQLVGFLLPDAEMRVGIAPMLPSIGSTSPSVYRAAQKEVSHVLAGIYADHALAFLAESVGRLSQLEAPRRTATLSVIPAWMQYVELSLDPGALPPDQADLEQHALANIMYLAIRFLNDHLTEVCDVLAAFASAEDTANTTALVKYLFEQGARRRSAEFVIYGQRVLACLSLGSAGEEIFNDICDFVQPDYMALASDPDVAPSPQSSLADLDAIVSVPAGKGQSFSTGQLALLFAGELLPHRLNDPGLSVHLPTLLHVAVAHCDSPVAMIRDQSQGILFQILRVWICDLSGVPSNNAAVWAMAEHKLTALSASRSTAFWKADDVGGADTAFFAPPLMTTMIMKILGVLLPLQPRIRQTWGELALTWATSCPIRHLACRSFQVFRTLSPRVNARMISDILARLSSTIGTASPEIQAFNLEVLRTFGAIAQNLGGADTALYPQLFWCAMACLTTPYEEEWVEVTELLSHILDKTNLSDPAVIKNLLSFQPPDWVGPPPHLQALLLVGLRSTKTVFMAFDLIRRLTSVVGSELIDAPADRLIHGFVAALPWMLHSTDLGEPNEDLGMMAADLAAIADAQSLPSFSRLLTSFARAKFRSKDDFIRQACSLLRDYMSSHALQIITLLLGFILNTTDWMRDKSLQILQLVLLSPGSRAPLVQHGTELLQPLLRLVSTPHAATALEILDMPIVAAAQAEALTVSMMASGEIFGSISPSGWSVARGKEMSALTRENVKAVFGTCGEQTRAASAHFSVVQFKDVRFGKGNESQGSLNFDLPAFSPVLGQASGPGSGSGSGSGSGGVDVGMGRAQGREGEGDGGAETGTGTGMSGDNASMGDLVNALHSLGQFFGEDLVEGEEESPRGGTRNARHAVKPSDTFSEDRVRAIMARGRNPSISSPVYETQPFINRTRHRANPSDAFTESSLASSTDGMEATTRVHIPRSNGHSNIGPNGRAYANGGHGDGQRYGYGYGFPKSGSGSKHSANPSFSSASASSDLADPEHDHDHDQTENVFGLDEGMMSASMTSLAMSASGTGAGAGAGAGGAAGGRNGNGIGGGADGEWVRQEKEDSGEEEDEGYAGLSEQSTPVLMRSAGWYAAQREEAGTPSPSDRRNVGL